MLRKVDTPGAASDGGVPRPPHWQDDFLKMCHLAPSDEREERASCCLFSTGDSKDGRRFFFFNLKGTLFRPTVGSAGSLSP